MGGFIPSVRELQIIPSVTKCHIKFTHHLSLNVVWARLRSASHALKIRKLWQKILNGKNKSSWKRMNTQYLTGHQICITENWSPLSIGSRWETRQSHTESENNNSFLNIVSLGKPSIKKKKFKCKFFYIGVGKNPSLYDCQFNWGKFLSFPALYLFSCWWILIEIKLKVQQNKFQEDFCSLFSLSRNQEVTLSVYWSIRVSASQLSLSCLSAVSQLSLSCLFAVSQQPFSLLFLRVEEPKH